MQVPFSPILAYIRPIIKAKAAYHAIPAYGPQAIKATAIPTGASFPPYRQPIGGELPWSVTNLISRLAPNCRQPPRLRPWRASQPPMPHNAAFNTKSPAP